MKMTLWKFTLVLFIVLLGWSIYDKNKDIPECVDRGVAYYTEVGSYPLLKTEPNRGRKAEEVAEEMCRRSSAAFSFQNVN